MNIYKLNNKEFEKLTKDFNKTVFGRRMFIFGRSPLIVSLISGIGAILVLLYYNIGDSFGVIQNEFFMVPSLIIVFLLSFVGYFIAQLFYMRALKEFSETVKKEKN